jgi:hypothetical protein
MARDAIMVYISPAVAAATSPTINNRSASVNGTAGPLLSIIRPTTKVPIICASKYVLNIQPNRLRPFRSPAMEGAIVVTDKPSNPTAITDNIIPMDNAK